MFGYNPIKSILMILEIVKTKLVETSFNVALSCLWNNNKIVKPASLWKRQNVEKLKKCKILNGTVPKNVKGAYHKTS